MQIAGWSVGSIVPNGQLTSIWASTIRNPSVTWGRSSLTESLIRSHLPFTHFTSGIDRHEEGLTAG